MIFKIWPPKTQPHYSLVTNIYNSLSLKQTMCLFSHNYESPTSVQQLYPSQTVPWGSTCSWHEAVSHCIHTATSTQAWQILWKTTNISLITKLHINGPAFAEYTGEHCIATCRNTSGENRESEQQKEPEQEVISALSSTHMKHTTAFYLLTALLRKSFWIYFSGYFDVQ